MIDQTQKLLLVGDNPFHRISHLSQERARDRNEDPGDPKFAAKLIMTAMENSANGFTFSVSETTLQILNELKAENAIGNLRLYPVVPYALEYVRLANQLGGISGLATKFTKDMIKSRNLSSIGLGVKGVLGVDPLAMLKTYLSYELSRVKSAAGKSVHVDSILLHQLITDMALALNLEWVFKSYVDFLSSRKIIPGFNTGNFAFLVNKFKEWNIDMEQVLIAAPFNKVGFQVTPSIVECENALRMLPKPVVIAISVLAAGYVSPKEAASYLSSLPNIRGVAIGVSKIKHAEETFGLFADGL